MSDVSVLAPSSLCFKLVPEIPLLLVHTACTDCALTSRSRAPVAGLSRGAWTIAQREAHAVRISVCMCTAV